MDDMKASTQEPTPVAEDMAGWERKLRKMGQGHHLDAAPADPGEMPVETPEQAAERRRRVQDGLSARWRDTLPVMYQEAALDDLDESQSAVLVRSWLHSGSLSLVLAGPVGTGKTHAAYAVGNQAREAGRWVEAYHVGDLLDAMRPGSTQRDLEGRARSCAVLILDDLTAKATEWEAERMTGLLDARVRHERLTVVTTNITAGQVAEAWGSRFMDRLNHRMTPVTFTGKSRRGGAW